MVVVTRVVPNRPPDPRTDIFHELRYQNRITGREAT